MTKRLFSLLFTLVIAATLTFVLSGCGNNGQSIDGMNVVTFELEGGTMELKTSSVDTKINFAYHPGTYILDPVVDIPGYKIYKQGYNFTGWYTSAECKPGEEWDFKTPFNTETLTLYAGWEKAIKYTYTVYYVEGTEAKALGSYEVKAGAQFDDWRDYAGDRNDYTSVGYFSDINFTTPWDESFKHPGGETDTDVAVYVDYIAGNWKFIDSFSALKAAIKAGDNVYLTADIDCGGDILVDPTLTTTYSGIIEGNNFKVSNFKVVKSGSLRPNIAIFNTLGDGAEIRNITFDAVAYDLTGISDNVKSVKASAIATNALGAKITNVSVNGTIKTNYAGELDKLNSAVYEETAVAEVTNFTATITVDNQN